VGAVIHYGEVASGVMWLRIYLEKTEKKVQENGKKRLYEGRR